MPKVRDQISDGHYTIIILDSPIPASWRDRVVIDGIEYKTEIVYDMENSLAIVGSGSFIGKEVQFLIRKMRQR